jgi:hypothetical protein
MRQAAAANLENKQQGPQPTHLPRLALVEVKRHSHGFPAEQLPRATCIQQTGLYAGVCP